MDNLFNRVAKSLFVLTPICNFSYLKNNYDLTASCQRNISMYSKIYILYIPYSENNGYICPIL